MELHHGVHEKTYVDKLNQAVQQAAAQGTVDAQLLASSTLPDLLKLVSCGVCWYDTAIMKRGGTLVGWGSSRGFCQVGHACSWLRGFRGASPACLHTRASEDRWYGFIRCCHASAFCCHAQKRGEREAHKAHNTCLHAFQLCPRWARALSPSLSTRKYATTAEGTTTTSCFGR